jgi:hypothetical protein
MGSSLMNHDAAKAAMEMKAAMRKAVVMASE